MNHVGQRNHSQVDEGFVAPSSQVSSPPSLQVDKGFVAQTADVMSGSILPLNEQQKVCVGVCTLFVAKLLF